jgi:type IV secretory pathway VirB9-like protein
MTPLDSIIHTIILTVKLYVFVQLFYFNSNIYALNRIESLNKNTGESSKIYIKPGLVTVLEMPQKIIEVRVGNPNYLKGVISQISPKEITLFLKNSNATPTNIILRSDRKMYVFDIIPSVSKHQDYIKVSSGIGHVLNQNSSAYKVLESSVIKPSKPEHLNRKLEQSEKVSL